MLVLLTGSSASGKTTLAKALARAGRRVILHCDRYYKEDEKDGKFHHACVLRGPLADG